MKLWAIVPELVLAGACVPLVAVAGVARGRWRRVPLLLAMAAMIAALAATARMLPWSPTSAFDGTYVLDGLAATIKIVIEGAALVTLLLFGDYFRGDDVIPHAPVALLFATVGAVGLCSSADLGLIVLFFQIMSLATYVLAAVDRHSRLGHEAALKYFIYGATALGVMAYGLTFLYGLSGTLDLAEIGSAMVASDRVWIAMAVSLIVVGYGFEMTLVPFHVWSPDVLTGATAPVAGFVSVVPKIAAFAALLRLVLTAVPPPCAGTSGSPSAPRSR